MGVKGESERASEIESGVRVNVSVYESECECERECERERVSCPCACHEKSPSCPKMRTAPQRERSRDKHPLQPNRFCEPAQSKCTSRGMHVYCK